MAWNGQKAGLGNGEILLGPVTVGGGKRRLAITGDAGKRQAAERKSEGVVVADDGGEGTAPPDAKGPYFTDAGV